MKSQIPKKKDEITMHNPTPIEPIGRLTDDEAKALAKAWFQCPPGNMANMFHTHFHDGNNFHHQRAVTYRLSPFALEEIIGKYQNAKQQGKACRLKVHMGCNSKHDHSTLMEGTPGFSPFAQLEIAGEAHPELPYANSYKCYWRPNSTIPLSNFSIQDMPVAMRPKGDDNTVPDQNNPHRVSPISAHRFLRDWSNTPSADLEHLFTGVMFGQVSRVRSFILDEENLGTVAKLWAKEPSRNLYIHMGKIEPRTHSPYGFHMVFEVATHTASDINSLEDRGSTFFEWVIFCPPCIFVPS